MNIDIQKKAVTFAQIKEGDLFVYNNSLYFKRHHFKHSQEYNSAEVGIPNGGALIGPMEDVVEVNNVIVK